MLVPLTTVFYRSTVQAIHRTFSWYQRQDYQSKCLRRPDEFSIVNNGVLHTSITGRVWPVIFGLDWPPHISAWLQRFFLRQGIAEPVRPYSIVRSNLPLFFGPNFPFSTNAIGRLFGRSSSRPGGGAQLGPTRIPSIF